MAIAFVPVRGGSKSIPLKNIKVINNKPLVYWCLSALSNVDEITNIIVATDSDKIEETVLSFNMPKVTIYRRDEKNASDTASTESVMLEYLVQANLSTSELFVLAQATSPLTQSEHIEEAFSLLHKTKADSLLSGTRTKRFFWNDNGTPQNYNYEIRPRRQEFNGIFMENGAFYINTVGNILRDKNRLSGKIVLYEMPEYTGIEIDEPDDWIIVENLMKKHCSANMPVHDIRLFLTDVDGTLTDSGMYYGDSGMELKKFNTRDGMAFELLRKAKIKTGIITGETSSLIEKRAKKIKTDYLYQGLSGSSKLDAAQEICIKEGISLSNVAYIGDDLNCIDLLLAVGWAACPRDAVNEVLRLSGISILDHSGGQGAVREFVDQILKSERQTSDLSFD